MKLLLSLTLSLSLSLSCHLQLIFQQKRSMTWNTLTTINHGATAANRATVRWSTQAPVGFGAKNVFKGIIKLQRFDNTELFRLACVGRYHDITGNHQVLPTGRDAAKKNKITIPLPAEASCHWSMYASQTTCSDGTKVKIISFQFTANPDGICQMVINIPFEDDENLAGAFHFARDTHSEFRSKNTINDNFLLE